MRNKFNNKHCKYNQRTYHSRREAGDAMWLDSLVKQGKIKQVIPQYKISLDVNYEHITNHYVDFRVELADGRIKFMETKGFPTEVYRLKLKLLRAIYPDMEYLINPDERSLLK